MKPKSEIKKRVISAVTCFVLFSDICAPALMAAASSYMNDTILKNVTPGGIYEDPSNKAQYIYGGNVVYKFKDSARGSAPLISFAPPGFKAGCNGISFTGGFLQVLGLDGLADQIQNAGTAVIYGILVGLIYSLPALEKVFAHIRQWSEWLQQMLKSACSSGIAMGREIGKKAMGDSPVGGMMNNFDSLFDANDKNGMGILAAPKSVSPTAIKDLVDKITDGSVDSSGNAEEKNKNRSDSAVANFKDVYVKVGLANVILYKEMFETNAEVTFDEKTIVPSGELEELYTIVVNIFGDISLDDKSIQFLKDNHEYMEKIIKNGNTKDVDQAVKDSFNQAVSALLTPGATEGFGPKVKLAYRQPVMNTERAARFFVFGSSEGSQTSSMEFRKPLVIRAKTPKYNQSGAEEMLFTSSIDTVNRAEITWKGLFYEAKTKIDCEITAMSSNSACSNTFPLVLPNARGFINTIKQLEAIEARKAGMASGTKRSAQSQALIDDLAQHEAFFFARYILNYIESEIIKDKEKMEGADLGAILQFEASFKDTKKEIEAQISKIITEDAAILDSLMQRFKRVRDELKMDSVKGYN